MNFDKGDTIVLMLTPKDGDIIVEVGYKKAKASESDPVKNAMEKEIAEMVECAFDVPCGQEAGTPEKEAIEQLIGKTYKVPVGLDDGFILPIPGNDAVARLKNRIRRAFAKLYGMDIHEVEALFDFEDMDEVIEENADVFWAMDPKQVAVALHRRINGPYCEE